MLYKPQFAYPVPDGYRDEDFTVPFQFTISGNGQVQRSLPWQLDDDNPFLIRGMYFPTIRPGGSTPGKVRIYDTLGNPLTENLVLALGMWGSGGVDRAGASYAWGFPIEPEILCAPSGVLTFDFQMTTTAQVASLQINGVSGGEMFAYAGVIGATGNGRTIQLIDPGAANVALAVAVVGGVNVQVTLATDGASVITSTYDDVVAAMNASSALVGIMAASIDPGSPVGLAEALAATPLTNGLASVPQTIKGSLYGVKRLRAC